MTIEYSSSLGGSIHLIRCNSGLVFRKRRILYMDALIIVVSPRFRYFLIFGLAGRVHVQQRGLGKWLLTLLERWLQGIVEEGFGSLHLGLFIGWLLKRNVSTLK